jgi:hypothetical protein
VSARREQQQGDEQATHKEVFRVRERLELEAVVARVLEEHCPLLAILPFKSKVRLNDELDARFAERLCKLVEGGHVQAESKVRDGHHVQIHAVEVVPPLVLVARPVHDELVAAH